MNKLGASDAAMGGVASRIPAAEKQVTLDEGAALLQSQGGTLRAEVQVIRKGTGKVENYTLIMGDQPKEP
jgi:hypothetical protein